MSDTELADYLADYYGRCRVATCLCLKHGWHGRQCANWQPCGAKDWDELRTIVRAKYDAGA